MNSIQIKKLEKSANKAILDNIQYIEKFNYLFNDSDKISIKNVVEETKFRLNAAQDNSKTNTYYDKCLVVLFSKL